MLYHCWHIGKTTLEECQSGFWKPQSGSEKEDAVAWSPPVSSSMTQHRMLLPIYKHKKQILYAVENFSIVIIVGETGTKFVFFAKLVLDGRLIKASLLFSVHFQLAVRAHKFHSI